MIGKYAEDINKLTHVHLQYTFVYHQLNYVQLRYAVTFKQKKSVTMKKLEIQLHAYDTMKVAVRARLEKQSAVPVNTVVDIALVYAAIGQPNGLVMIAIENHYFAKSMKMDRVTRKKR